MAIKKGGTMAGAMIQCSETTRLLIRADAQAEGVNMPVLLDRYVHAGRSFYKKTCKQSKQKRKQNKQEAAHV